MKKIFAFLFMVAMVATMISCESNIVAIKATVVKFNSVPWTDPGHYKCEAVTPNGDTVSVLMGEADFLNNPLPIEGTIRTTNQSGLKYFVSDNINTLDIRKVPATALELHKKPFTMPGMYECWIKTPSGDRVLAFMKETDYLKNPMPIDGYLSMTKGGGSMYFYLADTTEQKK